jgi:hypothetical protein
MAISPDTTAASISIIYMVTGSPVAFSTRSSIGSPRPVAVPCAS